MRSRSPCTLQRRAGAGVWWGVASDIVQGTHVPRHWPAALLAFHNPTLGVGSSKETFQINTRTWLPYQVQRRGHLLTFISFAFYLRNLRFDLIHAHSIFLCLSEAFNNKHTTLSNKPTSHN